MLLSQQFGCPADAFEDESHSTVKEGFPEGLLRLIQHPEWISRGCGVPTCGGTRDYSKWAKLKKQQKRQVNEYMQSRNLVAINTQRPAQCVVSCSVLGKR